MGAVVAFPFGERADDPAALAAIVEAQQRAVAEVMLLPARFVSAGRQTPNFRELLRLAADQEARRLRPRAP